MCPHGQSDAVLNGFRPRTVLGLLGEMERRRRYYHGPGCGQGSAPFDQARGLDTTRPTPAAREVIARTGAVESFPAWADELLEKRSGVRVSESTIPRVTEATGARIGPALAGGQVLGEPKGWERHRGAEGRTVAYVSTDATGVKIQGPRGAKADGRMIHVGMIDNPIPEGKARWARPERSRPAWQARYVTSLDGLDALGQPLRRQGAQVGMDAADRWVAIRDGGSGLEQFLTSNVPRVEAVILDFDHAAECLGAIGRAWHPGDDAASKAWSHPWCHELKPSGGEVVLAKLRARAPSGVPRRPSARSARRSGISRTRSTGWIIRRIRRRVGTSAPARWSARARA